MTSLPVFAFALAAALAPSSSTAAAEPSAPPSPAINANSARESTAGEQRPGQPAAVIPRYRGTGLFVGAGLFSAGALGLTVIAAQQPCEHYENCLFFSPAMSNLAAGTSLAAVPFAVFGARQLARYDVAVGKAPRSHPLSIAGAILLGLGVAGSATLRGLTPSLPCGKKSGEDYACFRRWNPATTLGAYGAEVVATAGAGMLSYGVTSKRGRQLMLWPTVSTEHWGLQLTARW